MSTVCNEWDALLVQGVMLRRLYIHDMLRTATPGDFGAWDERGRYLVHARAAEGPPARRMGWV